MPNKQKNKSKKQNPVRNAKYYEKVSYNNLVSTIHYLKNCKLYNRDTNEYTKMPYDPEWQQTQTYLYSTFVLDDLNYRAIESGLTPVFVTLTLPSEYHSKAKKFAGFTPYEGYTELVRVFRHLQDNFRVDRKRVEHLFYRVIEPHKDFTPHLHAIVWIPATAKKQFKNHFENTIKLFNFNSKGQDIKFLDTADYAVVYLMKYVKKTLSVDDDVILGWKQHHAIRQIASSRASVPRKIFSKLSGFVKFDKADKLPYMQQILQKVTFDIHIYEKNKLINTKRLVSDNPLFHVSYSMERNVRIDNEPLTYYIDDRSVATYSEHRYYTYRLLEYDITDFDIFETVYSSFDTVFVPAGHTVISPRYGELIREYGYGDNNEYIEYECVEYVE